jgi:serine/threonine protein kinase
LCTFISSFQTNCTFKIFLFLPSKIINT